MTKSNISMGPLQKSMSSTPSCFDFFWNSPIYFFLVTETGRKLGHNQLFSLSQFCPKNWARWVGGSKKVTIFEKKNKQTKNMHIVLFNRCSSNQQYIIKVKVREYVFIQLFVRLYYLYLLSCVCIDLYLLTYKYLIIHK